MDNIWYNVHHFYRQVSKFLTDRRHVDMEHLMKLGQELLKEDIGETQQSCRTDWNTSTNVI